MTPPPPFARKMAELAQIEMPFFQMQQHPKYVNRRADSCNFTFGNPHDMPLPGFVAALQKWSTPQDQNWLPTSVVRTMPKP